MTFEDFDVDPRCLDVLNEQNIQTPTPVQAQAIPVVLKGHDVVATAQTGTGKTLGFTLPGLTRLVREEKTPRNAMLVLVPTRELCTQVQEVVSEIGAPLGLTSVSVYGGVSLSAQATALKKGRHVVVATPGRLLDHLRRRNVRFRDLRILVLDEADRMLDMGFLPDIQDIIRQLPTDRQTLMFSATFPPEIERMASRMMHDPERISVGLVARPVETVRQVIYPVRQKHKPRLLAKILDDKHVTSALIFLRTRERTEQVAEILRVKGYKLAELHGERSQQQRQEALDGFRKGTFDILVATDVAARGLDIEGVSHVINYDIPLSADDYIHRIGRTARAEADGDAVTFVSPEEHAALGAIEQRLGQNIERVEWEDAPVILTMYHPPGKKRAGARRRGRGRMLRR